MQIPPSSFHALPTLPLIHHHGFSQGKETKYNHCRLPRGRGTVAAETGLSRWLSALGSQTLGLPQHMEDTNTGTCHAFEWLERTSRELMCRLKYLYCSFTLQLMVPTTLRTKTRPNFPCGQKIFRFLVWSPQLMLWKKKLFVPCLTILVRKFIPVWTLTWDSSHISIHKTENQTKWVFCDASAAPGTSTLAGNDGPANGNAALLPGTLQASISPTRKKDPKQF